MEHLDLCDYYLSELRNVDANIVNELANLDSADMIEAAAKRSFEIVRRPLNCFLLPLNNPKAQPFWSIQGITA